jgi:hypothetical protein
MNYFDYEAVAHEAGIPQDKLDQLARFFTQEEPHDPMLAELHTLRACMAVKDGRLTIEEALDEARLLAARMPVVADARQ